jgi:hypothetical protein
MRWAAEQAEGTGAIAGFWDSIISLGASDFGLVSREETALGFPLLSSLCY